LKQYFVCQVWRDEFLILSIEERLYIELEEYKNIFHRTGYKGCTCKYPSVKQLQLCILFVWANKYFVYLLWYGTLSWKQLEGIPFCCWLIAGSITRLCILALGGSFLNLDETVSYFGIGFSGFAHMPPHMCIDCKPTSL
jgi:hypothetical protein